MNWLTDGRSVIRLLNAGYATLNTATVERFGNGFSELVEPWSELSRARMACASTVERRLAQSV
jgi:hypothetical protein